METYIYPKSSFPNARIQAGKLHSSIKANTGITPVLSGVSVNGNCHIVFQTPLTGAEKIVLDGLVAAHAGADTVVNFHASSTILSNTVLITANDTWETAGELYTNPSFFVADLTTAKGRIVGQYKAAGAGAVIRLIETDSSGVEVVAATFNAPDTGGTWQGAKFFTAVTPRAGDLNYRMEAKAPAGTVFKVRAFSISLLEFVTVWGI
jgi:hypothetical protein